MCGCLCVFLMFFYTHHYFFNQYWVNFFIYFIIFPNENMAMVSQAEGILGFKSVDLIFQVSHCSHLITNSVPIQTPYKGIADLHCATWGTLLRSAAVEILLVSFSCTGHLRVRGVMSSLTYQQINTLRSIGSSGHSSAEGHGIFNPAPQTHFHPYPLDW